MLPSNGCTLRARFRRCGPSFENTATPWYADDDNDGFGDAGDMVMVNVAPMGYIADNSDCDDTQDTYADADGDGSELVHR